MTACGIERISDDNYVDASAQHLPKVEGVEGDFQLCAMYFCSIKSMESPSTHPPDDGRG